MSTTAVLSPAHPTIDRRAALPVAVIGAGPVGLAAAAELLERGQEVVVLESGETAGTAMSAWGHIRLFSPWTYLLDAAAVRLLEKAGWHSPEPGRLPLAREVVADYLEPLAAALSPRIQYRTRVLAVSRQGMDRTRSLGRAEAPFLLRTRTPGGTAEVLARAVIDASGTYSSPGPIHASGLEDDVRPENVSHALPDVLGAERDRFAGKHTLVVGAGHSAANTLLALARLADEVPGTTISWAIRSASPVRVYGSDTDALRARAALGSGVHDLVQRGTVALLDRFEIDRTTALADGRVRVSGRRAGLPAAIDAHVVVAATGFRPDLDMLREIRLGLDAVVEAPRALAPLIDPNLHSCGTVPPHGVAELSHPEPDFYLAGMKSYGRAPTFLLLTGYEQVRSIAAELSGDSAAARQVQLVLPETGVCSSGATLSLTPSGPASCCGG